MPKCKKFRATKNGKWIKMPWERQDSFYDIMSSGFKPSTPDSLQIKGAFQKRLGESLEHYNVSEHASEVNSMRQSDTSLFSSNLKSRHEETGKKFKSTKAAVGEWTFMLPKNAQRKFHRSVAKRNNQSSIYRAHSVPALKVTGSITQNKLDPKPTFVPDKAMSEINEKELECLPIELKRFRGKNFAFNNKLKSSKKAAYLQKVARIGRRAGLTKGQILQLMQSPKKKTLLEPMYTRDRHFELISALSP